MFSSNTWYVLAFSELIYNSGTRPEIEYEEIKYEKPELIIEKIEELEGQILENIAELKWLLNEKI